MIDPPSEEPAGQQGQLNPYDRTLQEAFRLWITPEVERRQSTGAIAKPYHLVSAQVVFKDHGNDVRLNSEVHGLMSIKPRGGDLEVGAPVFLHQIEEIDNFELPFEDRDFGHLTVIRMPSDRWALLFDFRRNRGAARTLLKKAEEFLSTARWAHEKRHWAAFADTLFSACELLAKAQLITTAMDRNVRTHATIHSRLNQWNRLGNTRQDFVGVFNRLADERGSARYSTTQHIPPKDGDSNLSIVSAELEILRDRLKPAVPYD